MEVPYSTMHGSGSDERLNVFHGSDEDCGAGEAADFGQDQLDPEMIHDKVTYVYHHLHYYYYYYYCYYHDVFFSF